MNTAQVVIIGHGNNIQFYTTVNGKPEFTSRVDDADYFETKPAAEMAVLICSRNIKMPHSDLRISNLEIDI